MRCRHVISKGVLAASLTFVMSVCAASAEESAWSEVESEVRRLGLVEGCNEDSGIVVGIGRATFPVEKDQPNGAGVWCDRLVELSVVARTKAEREVSKALDLEMSARRSLKAYRENGKVVKVGVREIRLRTEGRPRGCEVVSRRLKLVGGECQVAVAVKWSAAAEQAEVEALRESGPAGEAYVREWVLAAIREMAVGGCLVRDGKGGASFVGIGAAEIKGDGPAALIDAKRIADLHARRYVACCALESLSGLEMISKASRREGGEKGVSASLEKRYWYEVTTKAKGMLMPGVEEVYSSFDEKSVLTGARMCVSACAISVSDAKGCVPGAETSDVPSRQEGGLNVGKR